MIKNLSLLVAGLGLGLVTGIHLERSQRMTGASPNEAVSSKQVVEQPVADEIKDDHSIGYINTGESRRFELDDASRREIEEVHLKTLKARGSDYTAEPPAKDVAVLEQLENMRLKRNADAQKKTDQPN